MDIRRMTRRYGAERLPEKLATYVVENFQPKSDKPTNRPSRSPKEERAFLVEKIIGLMCEYFSFSLDKMGQKSRKRELVYARQVSMYFLSTKTKMSLKDIGALFGGKDHTTVIHGRQTILDLMSSNEDIRNEIEYLNRQI